MEAEAFFWRLYVIADDYGNFEVEPKTLVAKAGGLRKLKQVDIQAWIKEMEVAGLIKLYQNGKKSYGHFLSFSEFQVPSGPAQSPDFGMQRYCPESPWDTNLLQKNSGIGQYNLKNKELINTNTYIQLNNKNNNNTSSGMPVVTPVARDAREPTDQQDLFSDPNAFAEVFNIPNPREQEFIKEAFKYWQKVCKHPLARINPERIRVLKLRFKDSTLKEVKQAIDGCAKSDFHMGRQPNNPTRFDDLELICRNRSKIEMFMEKVTYNPKEDSWEEKKRRSDEAKAKWHGKK